MKSEEQTAQFSPLRPAETDGQSCVAGRELDALVAERVMGWEWLERATGNGNNTRKALFAPLSSDWVRFNFDPAKWSPAKPNTERFADWNQCCESRQRSTRGVPRYSTDIAAAWQVVEHLLHTRNLTFRIQGDNWFSECISYRARFGGRFFYDANSAPEAICRAALQATNTAASAGTATTVG